MNHVSDQLSLQMTEMKEMFENKFKELKSKNKVLFNQAVEKHFQAIQHLDENTI